MAIVRLEHPWQPHDIAARQAARDELLNSPLPDHAPLPPVVAPTAFTPLVFDPQETLALLTEIATAEREYSDAVQALEVATHERDIARGRVIQLRHRFSEFSASLLSGKAV